MKNKLIFSFDIGTGSMGICVRNDKKIEYLDSMLIPPEFASVKERAQKRRMIRTNEAHKAREQWWKDQAKEAAIEVLESRQPIKEEPGIKPDPRLLREFPADNDSTIYTSCLLRIALLQGRKLEGWQIYKAVRSAMQHRGYDADLPWKSEVRRNIDNNEAEDKEDAGTKLTDDEKLNIEGVNRYREFFNTHFNGKEEFYYPCYLEAYKMGVWSPKDPFNLSKKIGTNPSPARNKEGAGDHLIAPRDMVIKELKALLEKASDQFPKLKGKIDYVLFGPGKEQYASFKNKEYFKYRGKKWDWQGLVGQKIPRFDNRILSKCCLMDRFNTCKANDELNKEVTFLMQLKNFRYISSTGAVTGLTPDKINELFNKFGKEFHITGKKMEKWIKENANGLPHPAHKEIKKPKCSGRSRFCRPALKIIKEIILSGKSPWKIYDEKITQLTDTDKNKGLIKEDLLFLKRMPEKWEDFSIPDKRGDYNALSGEEREQIIEDILNGIINPVVRHRLRVFLREFLRLKNKIGDPDKIVLEFIREDFMGEKARKEYLKFINDRKNERDRAAQQLKELDIKGGRSLEKMLLFREQEGRDLYDGKPIAQTEIDQYEIDHIVPRSQGGPDAMYNKVLTSNANNQDKGDRVPYEWLNGTKRWESYLQEISSNKGLSRKKKSLLIEKDATQLVENYKNLAETAYITKLVQQLIYLTMGWDWQTKDSKRRIVIKTGGETAKVRRRFKLDTLLFQGMTGGETEQLYSSGKNRENKRHHALDALVLSVMPEFKYDDKTRSDIYPAWFNREWCEKELNKVSPHFIAFNKPVLAETIYGKRSMHENGEIKEYYISRADTSQDSGVSISNLKMLAIGKKDSKNIFDPKIRKDFLDMLAKNPSEKEWEDFVVSYRTGGSKPRKIALIESEHSEEFMDLSKIKGQYFKDKREHQGQIVFKSNDKWKVVPVYAYESLNYKMNKIKGKSQEVHFFNSLCSIEILNDFTYTQKGTAIKIKKGQYLLRTIVTNSGQAKIESTDGAEFQTNITRLMDEGKMRRADH